MTRACLECGAQMSPLRKDRPQSGYCLRCFPKRKWTPESRAKLAATRRAMWAELLRDPAKRAEAVASGKRLKARTPATPEIIAKQIAGRRRSHWVPEGYEELNVKLKRSGYLVAERQLMVAECQARDARREADRLAAARAAMSPLERQLEALRNGARLVAKPDLRTPPPAYTLGGNATGMI